MDEEVIPDHILNLICAVHLRQDHGYKRWTMARFTEHFPGLSTGDGGFGFTALHVLHHTWAGSLVLGDLGVEVAYLSQSVSREAGPGGGGRTARPSRG